MNIRMVTPLGVQEARERLPQILAGFAERTASEPVVVGAYRRPQGVIISIEEYEDLLAAREGRDRRRAVGGAFGRSPGRDPWASGRRSVE